MCKLQTELAEAQSIADDASKRMSTLEENVAELQKQYKTEKGERESLEKQLERSVANAAAASAAAQTLEMQTSKLMQELKDQGVEHATTLVRAHARRDALAISAGSYVSHSTSICPQLCGITHLPTYTPPRPRHSAAR